MTLAGLHLLLSVERGQRLHEMSVPLDTSQPPPLDPPDEFYFDIRTVKQIFGTEVKLHAYAACPTCCATYPPGKYPGTYPVCCTFKKFPKHPQCGTRLTKTKVIDSESHLVPIKPFFVQDFDDFKARLLCRPGIEGILQRTRKLRQDHQLWDVIEAFGVDDILDKDGKPFHLASGKELRLLWVLSVDWFNPYTMKVRGPGASLGSIALALADLPPSIRYEPENMYLSLIPGRREPSLDQTNHFLYPIIRTLIRSWTHGTRYSSTPLHPQGRTERSALVLAVFDMPGARKVIGHAQFNFLKYFCNLCGLTRDQIHNLNWSKWPRRTREDLKQFAEQWRDAQSQAERNRLFKNYGVRWSVLWELPYFNPLTMVVVDSMHNLFLGLVKYHFQKILGFSEKEITRMPPTDKELEEIESLFQDPILTNSKLSRRRGVTVNVLRALCVKYKINVMPKAKKEELIFALRVSLCFSLTQ